MGEGEEDEGEEDEEELENLVKLLLLVVNGSLFLESFLEVELDYGVQGLQSSFFRDERLVMVVDFVFIVRHWRTKKREKQKKVRLRFGQERE